MKINETEPLDLDGYTVKISELRDLAAHVIETPWLDPVAEGHLRLAISLLGQALIHLDMAGLAQARALADSR